MRVHLCISYSCQYNQTPTFFDVKVTVNGFYSRCILCCFGFMIANTTPEKLTDDRARKLTVHHVNHRYYL